jgi:hypothetical protein
VAPCGAAGVGSPLSILRNDGQLADASAALDAAQLRRITFDGPGDSDMGLARCVLHTIGCPTPESSAAHRRIVGTRCRPPRCCSPRPATRQRAASPGMAAEALTLAGSMGSSAEAVNVASRLSVSIWVQRDWNEALRGCGPCNNRPAS